MTASKPNQQGDFQADFDRLIQNFEAIAKIQSATRRRFILNRIASYYDISKAECRALYKSWVTEQIVGGAA